MSKKSLMQREPRRDSSATNTPRQLEPTWLRGLGFSVVALFVGLPLLVAALLFAIVLAPLVLAVMTWILLSRLFVRYDQPPYLYSRFACGLLVAWAVDAMLFRLTAEVPARHFVPALIVVSVFVGFYTWTTLPTIPVKHEALRKIEKLGDVVELGPPPSEPQVTEHHPFASFVSFMLMLFVMAYVIMPTLAAIFPGFTASWNGALGSF